MKNMKELITLRMILEARQPKGSRIKSKKNKPVIKRKRKRRTKN